MADDDLTPAERARLAELEQTTTTGKALAIIALEQGEHPDLIEMPAEPEPAPERDDTKP